jgi:hypothetical protein
VRIVRPFGRELKPLYWPRTVRVSVESTAAGSHVVIDAKKAPTPCQDDEAGSGRLSAARDGEEDLGEHSPGESSGQCVEARLPAMGDGHGMDQVRRRSDLEKGRCDEDTRRRGPSGMTAN